MPMVVWWMIAVAVGMLATRVVVDERTPVEQFLGSSLEVIGYGIVIALIILALGHVFNSRRKGGDQ